MPDRPSDDLHAALSEGTPSHRAEAVIALAPNLGAEAFPGAVNAATGLRWALWPPPREANEALASLGRRVLAIGDPKLLSAHAEALVPALACEDLDAAMALAQRIVLYTPAQFVAALLAVRLAECGRPSDALELLAANPRSHHVPRVLAVIGDRLTPEHVEQALALASHRDLAVPLEVFAALAPALGGSHMRRAVEAAQRSMETGGIELLARLVAFLDGDDRTSTLAEIANELGELATPFGRADVALTVARGVPEQDRDAWLDIAQTQALAAAEEARSPMQEWRPFDPPPRFGERFQAGDVVLALLSRLAPLLALPDVAALADVAIRRAAWRAPEDVAEGLLTLAGAAPDGDLRERLVAEAHAVARKLPVSAGRVDRGVPQRPPRWWALAELAGLATGDAGLDMPHEALHALPPASTDEGMQAFHELLARGLVPRPLPQVVREPPPRPARRATDAWAALEPPKRDAAAAEALAGAAPGGEPPDPLEPPALAHPRRDPGTSVPLAHMMLPGGGRESPADRRRAAVRLRAEPYDGPPVVSTGFATVDLPEQPLPADRALDPDATYLFWLQIGAPVAGAIDTSASPFPYEELPRGASLRVVLFAIDGRTQVRDGNVGELVLRPDGSVRVRRQPASSAISGALRVANEFWLESLLERRLFFGVHMPPSAPAAELRCNIYCHGLLVQSRLVRARLAGDREQPALSSELDYTLFGELDEAQLERVPEHRLSLLVNGDGDGSHAVQVVADDVGEPFACAAHFDPGELQDVVKQARGALRRVAWGSEDPWVEGEARYRYEGEPDWSRLEADLVTLAINGYRFYDACINALAGGFEQARRLQVIMRRPAAVQIAAKRNPRLLLPAALFYDYDFDTNLPREHLSLCATFAAALRGGERLDDVACLRGSCPNRGDPLSVCPSGFWGFRHRLGLPLSLAPDGAADDGAAAVALEIRCSDQPELAVAVSTDPQFTLRAAHERTLRRLWGESGWRYADSRADTIALLRGSRAPVVYFYCHGGLANNVAYIQVGGRDEPGITPEALRAYRIRWTGTRPLVFINGCHTTALEPAQAINFVSALIENAAAAGVIGTEITNFEPLASTFAEHCLQRFLAGEELGEAVRQARLELLGRANPLGLIYIPFALPRIRLVREPQAQIDNHG